MIGARMGAVESRASRRLAVLAVAVACLAGLTGCGGGGDDSDQLVVSAAASLDTAFNDYVDAAGIDAKMSFAGSDELAAQIRQGVKPDVYAAANTTLPDQLHKEGLVGEPTVFATNTLVLAVPEDSQIDSLDDLTKPGTSIVMGDPTVPVGSYTREVLDHLPADQRKAIYDNVRSEEPDVSSISGKLTQGAADAGFVYITDVTASSGQLKAIQLPADLQPQCRLRRGGRHRSEEPGGSPQVHRRTAQRGRGHGAPGGRLQASAGLMRRAAFAVGLFLALFLVLAFLTLPIVAIFVHTSPGDLISSLGEQDARDALWLSLKTSLAALAIIVIVGTPAAYLLATREFRGRSVVVTLIELPLVLPPAVAGIALLASFGPEGLFGSALDDAGIELVLQTAGVIVALTFVAAPFYLRQAQEAFAAVDRNLLDAARTLGASEARAFIRVAVPSRGPGHRLGDRAGLGAGPGRVRSDADVRRIVPGDHPDGAARHLRPLQ